MRALVGVLLLICSQFCFWGYQLFAAAENQQTEVLPLVSEAKFSDNQLLTSDGEVAPNLARLFGTLCLKDSLKTPKDALDYTQSQFLRKPGQERWQMPKTNFDDKLPESMPIFKDLGMIDAVEPKEKVYNHLLILGSSIPAMHAKVEWVKKRVKDGLVVDKVYFLTGARPLDLAIDLFPPIDKLPATEKPTNESQAAEWLWNTYIDNKNLKEKIVFVSVPMIVNSDASVRCPNTADTIVLWLRQCNPEAGKTLSLSSNPFIPYQHAVVRSVLKKAKWFENNGTLETVGEPAPNIEDHKKYAMGVFLDTIARQFYEEYNMFFKSEEKSKETSL